MRFKKVVLVCLIPTVALMLLVATSSAGERQVALIKAAVIRYICFDEYWGGDALYKRDKPLTMRVIIDGNNFYSKAEDAYSFHGNIIPMYQIGVLKPDKAVVTHNFEMDMKKRFAEGPVITTTLALPADCTPKYDPTTPKKELMLRTVVRTVQDHLDDWAKKNIAKYPRDLTLVVADFNVDYPRTYILVEQTNKVYRVSLHNPQDYDSDEYEREGYYPFGEQYNPAKSLIEKIRRHGIRKEIILNISSID